MAFEDKYLMTTAYRPFRSSRPYLLLLVVQVLKQKLVYSFCSKLVIPVVLLKRTSDCRLSRIFFIY